MREAIKRVLARGGFRIERLSPEEQLVRHGFDPRHPPPSADLDYLVPSNPRLADLEGAYRALQESSPEGTVASSIWEPATSSRAEDLRFFRGDNLYLWQYTRSPRHNAYRFFIFGEVRGRHRRVQLAGTVLTEDGGFGCFTFDFEGMPTLSRDLLDSVNEITFLAKHTDILSKPGYQVVDIGAGYGRLADRVLTAAPNVGQYWCLDAVARSTFLCEYYLKHRGLQDRGVTVPLHELEGRLPASGIDLAVNVHSFSEMPFAAVRSWLSLLAEREVPRLLIVPNEEDELWSREPDGSRRDCSGLLKDAGYQLQIAEHTIQDPGVRDILGDPRLLPAVHARLTGVSKVVPGRHWSSLVTNCDNLVLLSTERCSESSHS